MAMAEEMLPREAVLWMSVKHQNKKAIEMWAKEIAAAGTGGTPGITASIGGRPKPSPCLKLFSFLYPKSKMDATVHLDDQTEVYTAQQFQQTSAPDSSSRTEGVDTSLPFGSHTYRLEEL